MDVKWNCPDCGQPLIADAARAGFQVNCPKCQTPTRIPPLSQTRTDDTLNDYILDEGLNEWGALKIIATGFKVLAVLTFLACLAVPVVTNLMIGEVASPLPGAAPFAGVFRFYSIVVFIYSLAMGIITAGGFWWLSEMTLLMISSERNSGKIVRMLKKR